MTLEGRSGGGGVESIFGVAAVAQARRDQLQRHHQRLRCEWGLGPRLVALGGDEG